uniref:Endoglucanase n=2 Tax=Kalanchoe fedtschenkoi TaxID=63787 RepID=A0A7N0U6P4_KALFE
MHSQNHWGGSLEINHSDDLSDHRSDYDRAAMIPSSHHQLDETRQSWLLDTQNKSAKKKNKYVDLGCVIVSRKLLKWVFITVAVLLLVVALPIIIVKTLPKHKPSPPPPDEYSVALEKALLFFNAQKSGKLPKNNGISWRGNSGLNDGNGTTETKGGLVGGYYDAGDNIKFSFPMSYAMTMLSWSVIEYSHKYRALKEYDHTRELIKWGTDYLLRTFNSSSTKINKIYSQVGVGRNGTTPDDHNCWMRPEDMDYERPVQQTTSGPDLAGEMAAALAAASIVFQDDATYSKKLIQGAETVFDFARDNGRRSRYSSGNLDIAQYYNSTGYFDEYMWGAAWLYYATGNRTYLDLATNEGLPRNAKAFLGLNDLFYPSWDNKLPSAMLLLTRLRIILNPGYPYENMLSQYHNITGLTMCSYLRQFPVFNWTHGGLIQLNHGQPQSLQYAAGAAFLASLYVDYMNATGVPGWHCGPNYIPASTLMDFATSQIDYIMGENPMKMSYIVGYGKNFPTHVHHRGASIPSDGKKYTCTSGWKWKDSGKPNPHNITGAMVGGPDKMDKYRDVRSNYNFTEPTLAGNAGLVAALVSLTSKDNYGIDKNTIFTAVPPFFPNSPPPPPPWKP